MVESPKDSRLLSAIVLERVIRNNAQWRAIARAHSALRWSLARPNGEHQ